MMNILKDRVTIVNSYKKRLIIFSKPFIVIRL